MPRRNGNLYEINIALPRDTPSFGYVDVTIY